MRFDLKTAIYLFLAATFLGVALMAAPDYLHLGEVGKAACFWGGLLGGVLFGAAGFRAALLGKEFAPQKGHVRRMISLYGMLVCEIGFFAFAATFFFPRQEPSGKIESAQKTPAHDAPTQEAGKASVATGNGDKPLIIENVLRAGNMPNPLEISKIDLPIPPNRLLKNG